MGAVTVSDQAPRPAGAVTDTGPEPERLNLGSGEDYRDGFHNVDFNDHYNPDELVDLAEPWPTEWHAEFDFILASHIFEHLLDLWHAYSEAARCLRPGGILEVRVPFGMNADTDMTHEHRFDWDSGLQFARNWRDYSPNYQWDVSLPFVLEDRAVTTFQAHGPFGRVMKPVVWRLWHGDEKWISDVPFCSGEFTFRYRRIKEGER